MTTETVERTRVAAVVDDAAPDRASAPELADERLHLTDLRIQGFRCFEDLTVNRLGRVNLIAGRNGSGKSSFLDAVHIFADRGSRNSIYWILDSRSEFTDGINERFGPFVSFDYKSLFNGRRPDTTTCAVIGSVDRSNEIVISLRTVNDEIRGVVEHVTEVYPTGPINYIKIEYAGHTGFVPFTSMFKQQVVQIPIEEGEFASPVRWEKLGPDVPSEETIAALWEDVAITPRVLPAIEALGLLAGKTVEDIAVLGGRDPDSRPKAMVRLAGANERLALRTLGDGAVRAIGYVMALTSVTSGILLIDEVENGIHYTALSEFWGMILRTAQEYDVQVFATTHSWDCIKGFTAAAVENEDVDCAMFRLGETRFTKKLRAVEYTTDNLVTATRHGIEVR